ARSSLRSVPTRRSSDLELVVRFKRGVDKVSCIPKYVRLTLTPPPHILRVKIAPLAVKLAAHTLPFRRPANHKPRNLCSRQHALADRKSTRLNSSHVSIS